MRFSELRRKEVVNVRDGMRLGFIEDMEVNTKDGCLLSLVVPGEGKIMGVLGRDRQYVIEWRQIVRIGVDIILVDVDAEKCCKESKFIKN